MKIIVYFESGSYSEVIAEFADEDAFMACLPSLEDYAKDSGYIVTESVREDEQLTNKG
jgi:hypothetical protein